MWPIYKRTAAGRWTQSHQWELFYYSVVYTVAWDEDEALSEWVGMEIKIIEYSLCPQELPLSVMFLSPIWTYGPEQYGQRDKADSWMAPFHNMSPYSVEHDASDVVWDRSVLGQDRSQTKKIGLGLAGLVLCCETRSCYARRHNDLEGHSNFSSTICIFSVLGTSLVWRINSGRITSLL